MKYLSKEHEKAIQLKRNSDRIYAEHKAFLDRAEKMESKLNKSGTQRVAFNNFFDKLNKSFDEAENIADKEYYNHMNKTLNINSSKIKYTDRKKYKEGFMDEKYIYVMYKNKLNQERNHGKSKQRKRTTRK